MQRRFYQRSKSVKKCYRQDTSVGHGDFWVLKLDSNGNIQWQKTYGWYGGEWPYEIQQTIDGGYIVAGVTYSFGGGYFYPRAWALKLDGSGNIEWQKKFGFWSEYASSIQQTSDGGYIMAGIMGNDWGTPWVVKLDSNGNVQWQNRYVSSYSAWSYSVKQITNGGYVVVGGGVLKLDSNGNVQWKKGYSGYSLKSIQQTADDGYVVAGGGVLKLDSNGNIQWQKSYDGYSANSIQQTTEGGYIVDVNVGVLKLDSNGNISGCPSGLIKDTNVTVIDTSVTVYTTSVSVSNTNATPIVSNASVTNTNVIPSDVCIATEPNISVSPTSLNFGSVNMRRSSTQTVTISNTGTADLLINAINIAGTNASEFNQTNNCSTIAPNASCTITVTFAPTSLGTKSATLNVSSNDPDTSAVNISITGEGVDTTPPTTTVTLSGTPGNNDWYGSDVQITLTATDNDGGSGVKEIRYSIDGIETVVSGSSASLTINTEGMHTLSYYAIDNANNSETTHTLAINIDKTPPTITASASPVAGANGWNNTDVTVTFTCNDTTSGVASCPSPITVTTEGVGQVITGTAIDNAGNTAIASLTLNIDKTLPATNATISGTLGSNGWYVSDVTIELTTTDTVSGVKEITYSINGQTTTISGDRTSITLTADGKYEIIYYAVDNAGNIETQKSMTINIDKTVPTVTTVTATPNILWPPNHKMVDVLIDGSATDDVSGVASIVITVTDEYGIYNMTVPRFGSTIQLEAWREGTDKDGRVYTITVSATDMAGNQSTATTQVIVPHDMGK